VPTAKIDLLTLNIRINNPPDDNSPISIDDICMGNLFSRVRGKEGVPSDGAGMPQIGR